MDEGEGPWTLPPPAARAKDPKRNGGVHSALTEKKTWKKKPHPSWYRCEISFFFVDS